MSAEAREVQVQSSEVIFDNLSILAGLSKIVHNLDSRKREEIQQQLANFRLAPYVAGEDQGIRIYPHGMSREIPLKVQLLDDDVDEWLTLRPGSDLYDEAVSFEREFDPYFIGKSVEQSDADGELYVYSADHNTRVHVAHDTRFHLIDLPF